MSLFKQVSETEFKPVVYMRLEVKAHGGPTHLTSECGCKSLK